MSLEEQFEQVCAKFLYSLSKSLHEFDNAHISAVEFQKEVEELTVWIIEKEKILSGENS